jgi:hypothetical protein
MLKKMSYLAHITKLPTSNSNSAVESIVIYIWLDI